MRCMPSDRTFDWTASRRILLISFAVMIAFVFSMVILEDTDEPYADADGYTVTFSTNEYGKVDQQSVTNVPSGSAFTVSNNTLNINGVRVLATPNDQDEKYTYSFLKWSVNTGDTVTSDMTVTVTFTRADRTYDIKFMNDGVLYLEQKQAYGSTVNTPVDPSRDSDANCDYVFDCWDDYENNKIVKGDITFTATYKAVLKKFTVGSDGVVSIEPKPVTFLTIGIGEMDEIRGNENAKTLSVTLPNGKLEIGLSTLPGAITTDTVISIKSIDKSKYSEDLRNKIGDSPVYSVVFGEVTKFNGSITVSLKYDAASGETTSNLKVWYIKENTSYESIGGTYSDGYIKFNVDHLSEFAVVHDDSEASTSYSIWVVVAGAVAGVLVIVVFAIVIKKKTNE